MSAAQVAPQTRGAWNIVRYLGFDKRKGKESLHSH